MQTNIQIFDYKMSQDDREILHRYVDQIIDEGHLTNHTLVQKVEKEFKNWSDTKYTVAVNNGSSALIASLQAIAHFSPTKKRKVLLPSNTFIACWFAIIQTGFEPVILDSSKTFLGFDLNDLELSLSKGDVAAVLVVHIGGIIDNGLPELVSLCKKWDALVLEDAAHSHGSHLRGQVAGSIGDLAAFSFHLTKTITGGEGGLVATNNESLYGLLNSIRQFGKSEDNLHLFDIVGGNYKMSEMQAALLLTDLQRARNRIARRQEIAQFYFKELNNSSLTFFKPDEGSESSYYKCMALMPGNSKEKLIAELSRHHIHLPNGVYYWPLHLQPVVAQKNGNFKNTDKFSKQHICLPCYPELTDEQVFYFIDIFKRCESAGLV